MADPDFKMSLRESDGATEMLLSGHITEMTLLQVPEPAPQHLVIDVGDVQRINSMGVHTWLGFLDQLAKKNVAVTLRRLAPVLAQQASMISNFLLGARVESFMAPYVCDECEHELEQNFPANAEVPESIECPKCQASMEFDADMEDYLAFREP